MNTKYINLLIILTLTGCGKDGTDGKSYISYGSDGLNILYGTNYVLTIDDPGFGGYWDFNLITLESGKECEDLSNHEISAGTYHYTLEIWDDTADTLMNSYSTQDGYNTPLVVGDNEEGTAGEIGLVDGEDGNDWFYFFYVTYLGIVAWDKENLNNCIIE